MRARRAAKRASAPLPAAARRHKGRRPKPRASHSLESRPGPRAPRHKERIPGTRARTTGECTRPARHWRRTAAHRAIFRNPTTSPGTAQRPRTRTCPARKAARWRPGSSGLAERGTQRPQTMPLPHESAAARGRPGARGIRPWPEWTACESPPRNIQRLRHSNGRRGSTRSATPAAPRRRAKGDSSRAARQKQWPSHRARSSKARVPPRAGRGTLPAGAAAAQSGTASCTCRYQSTTEPSSGSNRGTYCLGSPTCAFSLSSSIVIPRPGSVSSGRCPFLTGGKGFARRSS